MKIIVKIKENAPKYYIFKKIYKLVYGKKKSKKINFNF
jgi:hypothetical protein